MLRRVSSSLLALRNVRGFAQEAAKAGAASTESIDKFNEDFRKVCMLAIYIMCDFGAEGAPMDPPTRK